MSITLREYSKDALGACRMVEVPWAFLDSRKGTWLFPSHPMDKSFITIHSNNKKDFDIYPIRFMSSKELETLVLANSDRINELLEEEAKHDRIDGDNFSFLTFQKNNPIVLSPYSFYNPVFYAPEDDSIFLFVAYVPMENCYYRILIQPEKALSVFLYANYDSLPKLTGDGFKEYSPEALEFIRQYVGKLSGEPVSSVRINFNGASTFLDENLKERPIFKPAMDIAEKIISTLVTDDEDKIAAVPTPEDDELTVNLSDLLYQQKKEDELDLSAWKEVKIKIFIDRENLPDDIAKAIEFVEFLSNTNKIIFTLNSFLIGYGDLAKHFVLRGLAVHVKYIDKTPGAKEYLQ